MAASDEASLISSEVECMGLPIRLLWFDFEENINATLINGLTSSKLRQNCNDQKYNGLCVLIIKVFITYLSSNVIWKRSDSVL